MILAAIVYHWVGGGRPGRRRLRHFFDRGIEARKIYAYLLGCIGALQPCEHLRAPLLANAVLTRLVLTYMATLEHLADTDELIRHDPGLDDDEFPERYAYFTPNFDASLRALVALVGDTVATGRPMNRRTKSFMNSRSGNHLPMDQSTTRSIHSPLTCGSSKRR